MIYIFTALYCEAHPIIQYFGLIRNNQIGHFQVFENRDKGIVLTITGVGSVAAATAVGSICTRYEVCERDFLINIGTCAGIFEKEEQGMGDIFLCNKIIDMTTMRTFYPDVLYRHEFAEASVYTSVRIIKNDEAVATIAGGLYDMEAAGIYQAGLRFLGPHQMSFLKIISDAGVEEDITPQKVEECIKCHMNELGKYVENLKSIGLLQAQQASVLDEAEEQWVEKVCEDMHCSVVMRNAFGQYVRYCKLAEIDYKGIMEAMYEGEKLPCNSKREGKKYFEEFLQQIF